MSDTNNPGAWTLGAFGAAVLLGGGNFLAVRFSNEELPPFWGARLRFSLAGLLFLAVGVARRLQRPRGRQLIDTAVYGMVNFALFYALMYWALVRVTAGMAKVVLAMVPLLTAMLAAAQRVERLGPRTMLGSLLALAGIAGITVTPAGLAVPHPPRRGDPPDTRIRRPRCEPFVQANQVVGIPTPSKP